MNGRMTRVLSADIEAPLLLTYRDKTDTGTRLSHKVWNSDSPYIYSMRSQSFLFSSLSCVTITRVTAQRQSPDYKLYGSRFQAQTLCLILDLTLRAHNL